MVTKIKFRRTIILFPWTNYFTAVVHVFDTLRYQIFFSNHGNVISV